MRGVNLRDRLTPQRGQGNTGVVAIFAIALIVMLLLIVLDSWDPGISSARATTPRGPSTSLFRTHPSPTPTACPCAADSGSPRSREPGAFHAASPKPDGPGEPCGPG